MLKSTILVAAFGLSVLAARASSAAVCAQIDTSKDTLSEGDRNGARILLGQVLRQQGFEVADQNCMALFVVYHVKLGNSITVFMQGPQGYRQATARAIEDIPAVYSQMVRSLVMNQPMTTINGTVDRTNATDAQQAPNRVEADSLWYFRLGYGGAAGAAVNSGPAFGFGYRYELDSLAIDLSFLNLLVAGNNNQNGSSNSGVTGSWVRLMACYYLNPTANGSMYLGGGLGYGVTAVSNDTTSYTGSGLQGELTAGFEFLRASTIRMFVEANGTLPFYSVHSIDVLATTGSQRSYVPSVTASFGIGWGRSPLVRVRVVQ
jgi:hypothetical protein